MTKEWLKLIKIDFMEGVEEPWCNNKGVAILPFTIKEDGTCYFMQTCEYNPLFDKNKLGKYSSITGGVENNDPLKTVYIEMKEETGIILTKKTPIYFLGTHYATKISTKMLYYYAIKLTALNLDINNKYYGCTDGTPGESNLYSEFVSETQLQFSNDAFALTIYGKLVKIFIKDKMEYLFRKCNINIELLDNYFTSKQMLDSSVSNSGVLKKNIFISGAAYCYNEFDTMANSKKFLLSLSNLLCQKNKIISGFGLGIGDDIISGVIKYAIDNDIILNNILDVWPFPQQLNKDSWTQYRTRIIDKAEAVIFVFGNKIDESNNIILSKGMMQEFEIAKNKNKIIIPIGSTGYIVKEILMKIENDIENYKYLKNHLQLLKNERNVLKISNTINEILDSWMGYTLLDTNYIDKWTN